MATPSQTPAPPPISEDKKSDLWIWVLGLVVAGVVILGVGGMIAAGYLARNIQVVQTSGRVEINTPSGGLKVDRNAVADPELPVYPGATVYEPGATVELSGPSDEAVVVIAAKYRTADPLDKVDAWYREQLGKEFEREAAGVMLRKKKIFGIEVRSDDIAYVSDGEDALRVVGLRRKGVQTEIALARIGKPETQ